MLGKVISRTALASLGLRSALQTPEQTHGKCNFCITTCLAEQYLLPACLWGHLQITEILLIFVAVKISVRPNKKKCLCFD